ncbi:MAG: molybdopterin oxidoreductase [Dehalococcoidales bacterium]|nr:molybdopterin oxidoreductase [Dehalococcoidales bacterium]
MRKDHGFSLTRRAFLKVSALAGAGLATTRLIKYPQAGSPLAPPARVEGVVTEQRLPTSCLNCATRCAIQVRVVNGKAVKITGNPLSLVSEGAICPRGHIGLQVLYDPERLTVPLKRTNPVKGRGIDPGWVPTSWEQALSEVTTRLKLLRDKAQPQRLLLLYGLNTTSNEDMIHRFAQAYGTPNVIAEGSFEKEAEKRGRWLADGNYRHIAYDIGQTNYILAFGAGILESEKPLARNLRMWGKIRRERPNRAKVVVIDPRYSVTAARADQWLPINPGTDAALAMAMANIIINEGLYHADFVENWTAGFDGYKKLALSDYRPEKVAAITGIDADTIRQIAREFARSQPAIAWTGQGVAAWPNGTLTSYAVFCLNALVGSIDVPGGILYQQDPPYREMPEPVADEVAREGTAQPGLDRLPVTLSPAANQVADAILKNLPYPVEMAIGFNSNFSMSAPASLRWDEALQKLPYYIHIAPFISEMAEYADMILPAPTFLEEWGYDHSPPGSGFAETRLKQPVVAPLHDTRCIADIIFEIAGRLGGTVARSFSGIGDTAQGLVRYRTQTIMPWEELLEKGVWVGPAYQYHQYDRIFKTPSGKFEFDSANLKERLKQITKVADAGQLYLPHYEKAEFLGDKEKYPLVLLPYQPLLDIENSRQNYPWAQEVFLVMHGVGWHNFAELNRQTAGSLGIKDGEIVWVESLFGRVKVMARVVAGIHPEVVGIACGQGHYAGGQWQKGIGVNPNEIIGVDYDPLSGQSAFCNTRVRVYKV